MRTGWRGAKNVAENLGRAPCTDEFGHSNLSIEAAPPVCAELTVVQLPHVRLCPGPIPGDGGVDRLYHEKGDASSKGPLVRALVAGAPYAPDSPDGGDAEEMPKAEESCIVWFARPEEGVISKEDPWNPRDDNP